MGRLNRKTKKSSPHQGVSTFLDHVRELQARLFWVVAVFVVVSVAAYPFFDQIKDFLIAPLGGKHELVSLTPGGMLGFIVQICMLVGFVGALPVIVYHIYRFVAPAIAPVRFHVALGYAGTSLVLALVGVGFAYVVGLPAAIQFLVGFDLEGIKQLPTVDSYFSFVMTYFGIAAVLFQIPLIMLVINTATPLNPSSLMKYQRFVIIGSVVVAAIVSPTPDAVNMMILATPIIIMYQVGVLLVWSKSKRSQKKVIASRRVRQQNRSSDKNEEYLAPPARGVTVSVQPAVIAATPLSSRKQVLSAPSPKNFDIIPNKKSMHGAMPRKVAAGDRSQTKRTLPSGIAASKTSSPPRSLVGVRPTRSRVVSVDGISVGFGVRASRAESVSRLRHRSDRAQPHSVIRTAERHNIARYSADVTYPPRTKARIQI